MTKRTNLAKKQDLTKLSPSERTALVLRVNKNTHTTTFAPPVLTATGPRHRNLLQSGR